MTRPTHTRDYQKEFTEHLEKNPEAFRALWPQWTEFIPHTPTGKQLAFLMLPHYEAFFGGAAGGGKSDALLMSALQYVDSPGYSALLLRKTFSDLKQPSALIARSHEWLGPWGESIAHWNKQDHQWVFPHSGATLQFGFMGEELARQRYQGAEYQFIGFDELAQHREQDYLYMFSRLRRLVCSQHKVDSNGNPVYAPDCPECQVRNRVPLRMRAASNPPMAGDAGGWDNWIKKRFQIQKVGSIYRGTHPTRAYIPAFLQDNPFIDQSSYAEGLRNLDPVARAQLLEGDWGVAQDGRFRREWMKNKYFCIQAGYLYLSSHASGNPIPLNKCHIFQTVDPAGSVRGGGPGDEFIFVNKAQSWTVISTWILTPTYDLCWLDCVRFQKEVPDIFPALQAAYRKHRPEFQGVESNGFNLSVFQLAKRMGLPVRPLSPRASDKLVRATPAIVRMEQGKIWLPSDNPPWLEDVETELFSWQGHPREADDIIDTLAYAALYVSQVAANSENRNVTLAPHMLPYR